MAVTHDANKRQFQIQLDDSSSAKGELSNSFLRFNQQRSQSILAYLTYELNGDTIDFQHTYVPSEYRGQGIAEKLVQVSAQNSLFLIITDVILECIVVCRKSIINQIDYSILFLCR